MIEIQSYLATFQQKLETLYKDNLFFFGIQGSYARGEATENSDIDVVVILQQLTPQLLLEYRKMISQLPFREKLCGFVSGKEELLHWAPQELFQFYYDTTPILGTLDCILPLITKQSIKESIQIGACTIYHACCHNILHETSTEQLKALLKCAIFLLQAKSFLETEKYHKTKNELLTALSKEDAKILLANQNKKEISQENFQEISFLLLQWASNLITKQYQNDIAQY